MKKATQFLAVLLAATYISATVLPQTVVETQAVARTTAKNC